MTLFGLDSVFDLGSILRVSLERAFVLRQPWAQAVVDGAFPALIRRLSTNIRGHVGVLAAKNRDPAGFAAPEAECPRGAIVGAVELAECVRLESRPREFLTENFGQEVARFYPDHFLPDSEEVYAWLIGEAIPAETAREVQEVPRTWARCDTWIEGEPIPVREEAEVAHP